MTIASALTEFLNTQKLRYNSSSTIDSYRWQLAPFITFASNQAVDQLTLDLCNQYKLSLRAYDITSVTCQSYCRALRVFLKWMYEEGILHENIAARFTLPKAKRKVIDTLTDFEIKRLYQCDFKSDPIKVRNGCLVTLMLDSGLRLSEAVTLRSELVNIQERYIVVDGKGGKQRIVPIGLASRDILQKYKKYSGKDYYFLSKSGDPITVNTVKDVFRKLKKESFIPRLRPHLLRHTFATRYLQNGGDLFKLQRILGHTSIEMTKRYLHLSCKYVCNDFDTYSPLSNMAKNGG